ncbi:MAG: ferrous iron transport protein B [Bacteroidaceae bacterium]|nr:ferrous iron transport protein B [Bacteroidaceae bacterium]
MTLKELQIGTSAVIQSINQELGNLRQHLLDMGIIPGAAVSIIKRAPMGDPIEIMVNGYSLTLRQAQAENIIVNTDMVEPCPVTKEQLDDTGYNLSLHEHNAHPGYGEEGKYHSKEHENPLPADTTLRFALLGQPNAGKTTLFNALTGSNQHVGNFPGVTVDRKDGQIKGHPDTIVTDLPGIYSLSTYTAEELVARNFILHEKPHAIINIIDANNIERNLYLTVQLMELEIPIVLALNMMDEMDRNGGNIRINKMEQLMGLPIVPIAAAKGRGIDELIDHAMHIARYQEAPQRQDFCGKDDHGGAIHRGLHSIMHLIEDHTQAVGMPVRFAASRLVEGDKEILEKLNLDSKENEMLEDIVCEMEQHRGLDRHAAMAEMRFDFINKLCGATVIKPKESKEHQRSNRIDRVLTGRWTAIPAFIAILVLIIWLTIDVIGAGLQDLLANGISALGSIVDAAFVRWQVAEPVRSLVSDAIFGGVGTVLSFVPIVIVLFFFLSMLEDSGYMARIAFVSDKLLRHIGLSGRSIVPMLIGFGCTVPGVMAARTLPSAHDRKTTILLTPFMSCSAKLPIYAFFTSAFFPGHGGLVLALIYLLGIFTGVLVAVAKKYIGKRYEPAPFVMELPVYRIPTLSNVSHLLWDKTKDFVQRAFTVIFLATLIIWFLESFSFRLVYVQNSADSMLAAISGLVAPIFKPMGLDDWRIVTSLVSGFMAKENVVSTMQVLGVGSALTIATAVPMIIFCLLYTPCVAAIAAIRRELGRFWALAVVIFQCAVAWIMAEIGYLITLWIL